MSLTGVDRECDLPAPLLQKEEQPCSFRPAYFPTGGVATGWAVGWKTTGDGVALIWGTICFAFDVDGVGTGTACGTARKAAAEAGCIDARLPLIVWKMPPNCEIIRIRNARMMMAARIRGFSRLLRLGKEYEKFIMFSFQANGLYCILPIQYNRACPRRMRAKSHLSPIHYGL